MYTAPRRLRKGASVAIVAPASPFKGDELTAGLDVIREMGLNPVLGPCVRSLRSDGIHAASVADRVEEMNWAYRDPKISGIIPVVGGCGSAGILPYLDYEMIRKMRKPMLGMSDITALNTGFLTEANLISISGQSPSIRLDKGLAVREADSESLRLALRLMMSDAPWGEQPW